MRYAVVPVHAPDRVVFESDDYLEAIIEADMERQRRYMAEIAVMDRSTGRAISEVYHVE